MEIKYTRLLKIVLQPFLQIYGVYIFLTIVIVSSTASISTRDEFYYHETLTPELYHENRPRQSTYTGAVHVPQITLILQAFEKTFIADLVINHHLLTESFIEKTIRDGNTHIRKPTKDEHSLSHCYYHGHIRGVPTSMVAISTCHGVSGFLSDDDEVYHIEPITPNITAMHAMYRESDRKRRKTLCGLKTDESTEEGSMDDEGLHLFNRMKRSIHGPYDSDDTTRYLELYLAFDHRVYDAKGRSDMVMFKRAKDIVNIVSRLYRALNIYVALVGVEVWSDRDESSVSNNPDTTMENFLRYRRERINAYHQNDAAHLITGIEFAGGVVGKAMKGPICTYQNSGGVDMDYSALVTPVATTLAHELGHNFGMEHDNSTCDCAEDKCIMAATIGSVHTTHWSSCSKQVLVDAFDHGMDYCLRNRPERLFESPVCGNGFVEDGEECDCGLPEMCENRCCNAGTCQLQSSARCATGKCCDLSTCEYKKESTLCRPADGQCDLDEFCRGDSEYCPDDVYKHDGQPCYNHGDSFCYQSQCRTHVSQCKLLWGSSGQKSDDLCYERLNPRGSKNGNCGYNWTTERYYRCEPKNALCGMLHCRHLNEKLVFWKDNYAISLPATFIEQVGRGADGKKYVCRGAVLDVGLDMPDPGMVPDGAMCGPEHICLDQECVSLDSALAIDTCGGCNGNGVCNNHGNCHCDDCFDPPNCEDPGPGGSVDSGPSNQSCKYSTEDMSSDGTLFKTSIETDHLNNTTPLVNEHGIVEAANRKLLIGLLLFFLVIVPLVGVAAFCGYKHHEELKRWWNKQDRLKYRVPKLSRAHRSEHPQQATSLPTTPAKGASAVPARAAPPPPLPIVVKYPKSPIVHKTPPQRPQLPSPHKLPPMQPAGPIHIIDNPGQGGKALASPKLKAVQPGRQAPLPPGPPSSPPAASRTGSLPKRYRSFRNGDPPVISPPVLTNTTDRKSKMYIGQANTSLKSEPVALRKAPGSPISRPPPPPPTTTIPDQSTVSRSATTGDFVPKQPPVYINVPPKQLPPRPEQPPRPLSFHEQPRSQQAPTPQSASRSSSVREPQKPAIFLINNPVKKTNVIPPLSNRQTANIRNKIPGKLASPEDTIIAEEHQIHENGRIDLNKDNGETPIDEENVYENDDDTFSDLITKFSHRLCSLRDTDKVDDSPPKDDIDEADSSLYYGNIHESSVDMPIKKLNNSPRKPGTISTDNANASKPLLAKPVQDAAERSRQRSAAIASSTGAKPSAGYYNRSKQSIIDKDNVNKPLKPATGTESSNNVTRQGLPRDNMSKSPQVNTGAQNVSKSIRAANILSKSTQPGATETSSKPALHAESSKATRPGVEAETSRSTQPVVSTENTKAPTKPGRLDEARTKPRWPPADPRATRPDTTTANKPTIKPKPDSFRRY